MRLREVRGAGRRASIARFGRLGERGPADGPKLMVIPGFLATDRTTLGLQRALAEAGFRVTGWGLGLNTRRHARTRSSGSPRGSSAFGGGEKVILVGWSLGGVFARERRQGAARPGREGGHARLAFLRRPRAATMSGGSTNGSPAIRSTTRRSTGTRREAAGADAGHLVAPRRHRRVRPARAARPGESDRQVELDCSHMGFARQRPGLSEDRRGDPALNPPLELRARGTAPPPPAGTRSGRPASPCR